LLHQKSIEYQVIARYEDAGVRQTHNRCGSLFDIAEEDGPGPKP
jgi:hypothetical protein